MICLSSCFKKSLVIHASTEGCIIPEGSYVFDSLMAIKNSQILSDTTNCGLELKARFSAPSIKIAGDMKITPLLCDYAELERDTLALHHQLLPLKVEVQQQILVSITDLNSLIAEITCERERMQELYDALSGQISRRINKATVYSILAGGITTIAAGIIALDGNETVPYYEQGIGISGALAATYWGFRAIAQKSKIKYLHPRNHLSDIWLRRSEDRIYSPYIWNFLSRKEIVKQTNTDRLSLICEKWTDLGLLSMEGNRKYRETFDLILGEGGNYTLKNLEKRMKMYEILMDEIITINYDLNRLQEEIMLGFKLRE